MCVQFSNYCNATLTVSHSKKIQGVAIIFKHFYKKFFFLRAFQAPLKSNIKFQGFSSTSRSSTNHGKGTLMTEDRVYIINVGLTGVQEEILLQLCPF